jgi:hypothetical protein
MKKRLLLGVALLVLVSGSLPALAAPADSALEAARAAIFASVPESGTLPEAQEVAKRPRVTPKATATARCWDGTTRTCSGTTASAVDSNCSSNQGGYCTGSSTGTLYCPACSTTCSAYTQCSPSGSRSCTGTSGDCFSVHNCYAYCDGNYYLCPSTPSVCPF